MPISLTREQFMQRLEERKAQIELPTQEFKHGDALERFISQDKKLSEIMGTYLAKVIDVVYREP